MARPEIARVEVDGLRDLRRAIRRAEEDYSDLREAGLEAAEPVADTAVSLVPVLDAELQGTIRAAGQASGAVVRAGFARVPYAGPIHFGWPGHGIEPNPFLYNALDQRRSDVMKIYERRVNEISRRVA